MATTDNGVQYTNTIQDGSNDRKYFVQVPQIVWAKCDSPHEYMLWNVVKMIAAENGECYVTTPGLARMCMMGTGTVSRARRALLDKGLLTGRLVDHGHGKAWHLSIPDLWAENVKWRKEHQALTRRMGLKPARTKEQHDEPSTLEGLPSPLERKKNPPKEEPEIPAQAQIKASIVSPAAVPSESEKNEAFNEEMLGASKRLNAQPPKHISAEQRIADTRAASARGWARQNYSTPLGLERALKRYGDAASDLRQLQMYMSVEFGLEPDWGDKQQVKSWASGLKQLWVASGEEWNGVAIAAGNRLRDSGMTISSPRSLVNTARAIAAERATAYVAPSARAVREYV